MRRLLAITIVLGLPALARAGGFELSEQTARGLGMAGAQAALADDPGAIYYNPAGLTFQRGNGSMTTINVLHTSTDVRFPSAPGSNATYTAVQPSLFIGQRLGPHFAVGIGLFSNFAQHFDYPANFPGRFQGSFIDITTITINPTVAIRPIPRIAVGFGLDIVPATVELRRALNFGSAEGDIHVGATATGVGGNVGFLAILVPRYLTLGATYRSTIDLDYNGQAAIGGPPELAALTGGARNASTTLSLPHNFSFALASHPLRQLALNAEAHVTLWQDLAGLTLTVTDPKASIGTPPTKESIVLNWRNSVGLRFGGELWILDGKVALRLGVGYDFTPVPASTITPISPDANRILVAGGVGLRHHFLGVDLGYLAAILPTRTSGNPDLPGVTFSSVGHIVGLSAWLRLEDMFGRLNDPAFKN